MNRAPPPGTAPEPPDPRPSLCVINHNGIDYLDRCLSAVEKIRASLREVLLIDDASTDGSVALVEQRFPWVRVIRVAVNAGPSAARARALAEAQSTRVLCVDNDVSVPTNCADRLGAVLDANPRAAVAVARIVYIDRPDTVQFDGAESHFTGLQVVAPTDIPIADAPTVPRSIGSLISSCFLVDRSRLPDGFSFDPALFIYLEDHDFGLRVRAAGREIIAVPDVTCLHGAGTLNLSIRHTGVYTRRRVFCLIRNRWLVVLRNYRVRTIALLLPAFAVYEAAQLVMVLKRGWFGAWCSALWWTARHAGTVIQGRREVQRMRVVDDGNLLVGGPIPFRSQFATGSIERFGERALNGLIGGWWTLVRRFI